MAKTAKNTDKGDEINLDEGTFFKGVLIAALVLCGLVYGSPLKGVFLAEFGLYANLAVLFYLLAFAYGVKGIRGINLENWEKFRPLAVLSLAALVMAAEELRWGMPFVTEEDGGLQVGRIRDLVSMALIGIPDGATLWMAGVVAGTRLLLVLILIYAIGGGFWFRERLKPLWKRFRAHPAFLYACFFTFFLLLTIFITAKLPALFALIGAYLRMGAGLSFFMMILKVTPKKTIQA